MVRTTGESQSGAAGRALRRGTLQPFMPMLVRHQWVREHGTPRVTTLAGRPAASRAAWFDWLRLSGRTAATAPLFEQPARAGIAWLDRFAGEATRMATANPRQAVAIAVNGALLDLWLRDRDDRLRALISEGIVPIGGAAPKTPRPRARHDASPDRVLLSRARSLAELTLFEALQATPDTTGRFELNQRVSFHFGGQAAEVDLLSRPDDLAIEVDGWHHFQDPDHYRRDRRKDLLLQAHGYAVVRVLAEDVLADPRAAVQMVRELLAGQRRRTPRTP